MSKTRLLTALVAAATVAVPPVFGAQTAAEIDAIRNALAAGDPTTAVARAEALAADYPDSPRALIWLGHAYRLSGDRSGATRAYLSARALSPDDPELLMGLGELQETTGDYAAAAATYARVIELAPAVAAPYRRAGSVQMQLDHHRRAAEYFAAHLERDPADLEVAHLLGVALYLDQDHDAAIHAFESALALSPGYLPALYGLGVVLADRPDEYPRALELLRRSAAGGWEEVNAMYLVGRILSDQGDQAAAVVALERTLELDPSQLDANYRIAQALARLGETDRARVYSERFRQLQQEFNAAESRAKELDTLRNALAAALRDADIQEADRVVHRMLAYAPEDPDTLIRAAKVWISTGNDSAATDAVVAALQLEPGNWEGLYLRGLLLSRSANYAAAGRALELALAGNPLFPDTHSALGNVLLATGSVAAAIQAYLAAIDLDPDNPGYHLNLATAYARQGRSDLEQQALAEYERLLKQRNESDS